MEYVKREIRNVNDFVTDDVKVQEGVCMECVKRIVIGMEIVRWNVCKSAVYWLWLCKNWIVCEMEWSCYIDGGEQRFEYEEMYLGESCRLVEKMKHVFCKIMAPLQIQYFHRFLHLSLYAMNGSWNTHIMLLLKLYSRPFDINLVANKWPRDENETRNVWHHFQ